MFAIILGLLRDQPSPLTEPKRLLHGAFYVSMTLHQRYCEECTLSKHIFVTLK